MDKKSINFLHEIATAKDEAFEHFNLERKKNLFAWSKIIGIIVSFVLLVGLAYSTKAVISGSSLSQQFGNTSVFEQIMHLVGSEDKPLKGEEDDRINMVLFGIGGENHDGGQLTDTIIVASIQPSTSSVGMLSIPRDLVVPIPKVGWQKINSAHAYGAAMDPKTKGAGAKSAKQVIEDITGLKIDYYLKLDFAGFTKIIDALGGIRVFVQEDFTDYQYPDNEYGYDPVHFDAGWQNLDGDAALKYVRSRHASGNEGSDFARARRQQDVLRALQARTLALSTLLNPNKLISLADIIGSHLETDMEIWESLKLFEIAKKTDQEQINQFVLSTDEYGLLTAETNEEGIYILRPRAGADNFTQIKALARNLLQPDPYEIITAQKSKDKITVSVYNGTTKPGLAAQAAKKLQAREFQILEISNASRRDYEKTVIYNLSDKDRSKDIQLIRELLSANVAEQVPKNISVPDADILVIVGNSGAQR